jgi:hypothetical protein
MKILQNAVLALLLSISIAQANSHEVIGISMDLANSFAAILDGLDADTVLYAQLQNELDDVSIEFESSADERRHLYCCVCYTFEVMKQQFAEREQDLFAIIDDKNQAIADLEERYEILKEDTAYEIESLYEMLDVLTMQLDSRHEKPMAYISLHDLNNLLEQIQEKYVLMHKQRSNFLAMLDALADKVYGHFEIEAIESAVFGEHLCGTMYCPELSEQDMVDAVTEDHDELDGLDLGDDGFDLI